MDQTVIRRVGVPVGWVVALLLTVVLLVLITLPPFLEAGPRAILMYLFAPTCHQIPERSPHLHGIPLAVCFRCYGVYWGMLFAALGFYLAYRMDHLLDRHARWVLAAGAIPAAVDWTGGVVGLWESGTAVRFITGGLFGLACGYFLTRALVQLFSRH